MTRRRWLIAGFGVLLASTSRLTLAAEPDGQLSAQASAGRTLQFSGYEWLVKSSAGKTGPGPNYFSDSRDNVWVDARGRLHLRLTRRGNRWFAAEVVSTASFGYGTYRFYLDSPVDSLDPNAVLGLFTWHDDPAYNHRELDIEFSRWGNWEFQNAQFVVQPYTVPGRLVSFTEPPDLTQTTQSFQWTRESVSFRALRGHYQTPPDPSNLIAEHVFTEGIPQAGGENARMNLWLFEGRPPLDRREIEVIIKGFEFTPNS